MEPFGEMWKMGLALFGGGTGFVLFVLGLVWFMNIGKTEEEKERESAGMIILIVPVMIAMVGLFFVVTSGVYNLSNHLIANRWVGLVCQLMLYVALAVLFKRWSLRLENGGDPAFYASVMAMWSVFGSVMVIMMGVTEAMILP